MTNRLRLLLAMIALSVSNIGFSQISLPLNTIVTENFNAIGSSASSTLPAGWRMSPAGNSVGPWSAGITAVTQAANSVLPTTGGRYNWATTAGTDRAIGFLTDASYVSPNAVMAHYRNTTGSTVNSVTISFAIERYVVNTATVSVAFFSSTDGTTWTPQPIADINTTDFQTGAAAGSFSSPTTLNKVASVAVTLLNNADIYFRWVFTNSGNTNAQGLGLDNVAVYAGTATPVLIAKLRDILQVDNGMQNQFNEGDVIRYGTVIKNIGTDNANNVQLNIPPPSNTTLVPGSIRTSAVAVDDKYATSFNTTLNGTSVLANDFGIPAPSSVLTYGTTADATATAAGVSRTTDAGGNITLLANGTFIYTPPIGFSGVDYFKYITGNGNLPNNDATVTIQVAPDITITNILTTTPTCNGGTNGSIQINATGGSGTLQYSITGAAGTYQASNVFSGLPAGTYNIAVKDQTGYIKTAGSSTVLGQPTVVVVNSTAIPNQVYNVAMTPVNFTKSGGTGTATWSATGLPTGVSINSSTGAVSGTPTQTGTFNAVVAATDANGCTGMGNVSFTVAPNAATDAYTGVVGNTQFVANSHSTPATPFTSSATNILANDASDAAITVTAVSNAVTVNNGSITISADGRFTYTPPVGYTGADSYAYTITSNGVTATGTINFTVANMVWYVNNTYAGANGSTNGTSHRPFTTANAAAAASAINQIIYIHTGSGNTTGNVVLKSGQILRGAGSNLGVGTLGIPAGTKPILSGTVTLANGVTADGFDMNTGTNAAITNGGTTVTDINVDLGNITTTTGTGVSVTGTGNTGTMRYASISTGAALNGVNVTNFASPGYLYIYGGTISNTTGTGINLSSVGTAIFSGVTINQTTQTALALSATPMILDGSLTIATSGGGTGLAIGSGTSSINDYGYPFRITNTGSGQGLVSSGVTFSYFGSNGYISTQTGTALNLANTTVGSSGIQLTSVSSNGAANGINLTNVTGPGAIYIAIGTLTGGAGAPVNISGGNAGFYFGGSASQATAAQPLVNISGYSGTATFSNGTLQASNGTGLQLSNVSGTVNFQGNTTLAGGDAGIDIVGGSSGTFNFGTNFTSSFTVFNPTGNAININGSAANVNYGGSFTKNNNATTGISITNNTGGTISFSGSGTKTLSTQTANAVNITGNSGGTTVNFGGNNLSITTTSGVGFNATTTAPAVTNISVTGTGNTITSPTGTALNVVNTTIGSAGLTFQNISSSGSATATGIILNNTGLGATDGGLTVTGTGTVASGGTISNKTGADNVYTTGCGIYLENTKNPSFTRMQLNDFQNHGIYGANVAGFTFNNSVISGVSGTNGNGGFNESSIAFRGLTGSCTVSGSSISGGYSNNFYVTNNTGILNRLTFTSTTIGANSTAGGNDGILVEGTGTATVNVTIQTCTFTSAKGDLLQMIADGSGGGDLIVNGSNFSNNHPGIATGGGGVTINGGATGNFTVNMDGNTFRNAIGHALLFVKSVGIGNMAVTVNNNQVGVAATANSGSTEGDGMKFQHAGSGSTIQNPGTSRFTLNITNNQIRQYNNQGLHIQAGAGIAYSGNIIANITGNTIANPGNNAAMSGVYQGLHLNSGVTPGDNFLICLNVGVNSIFGSGRNGGTDFRVRARQSTTVRLPGYAGGNMDTAGAVAFLQGKIGGGASGSAQADAAGGGFVGTACQ